MTNLIPLTPKQVGRQDNQTLRLGPLLERRPIQVNVAVNFRCGLIETNCQIFKTVNTKEESSQ